MQVKPSKFSIFQSLTKKKKTTVLKLLCFIFAPDNILYGHGE